MTAPDTSSRGQPPLATRPGERSAVWVSDHLDAVYRYVRRHLPPEDAEDVTQQVFLALFRADAEGRALDDAGAWLFGAARRRVADFFRRRARRPNVVPMPAGWDAFADVRLPDEVLETAELRELVHVALGLLPAGVREVLQARYREGASVREIARRLDVTEKAAEMRLRRAREAFQVHFLAVGNDWAEPEAETEHAGEEGP